jgi:excinuclease ABC subunit A
MKKKVSKNPADKDTALPKDFIHIKGARSNNLKNVELFLPKNQLIVVTGVSGSGKSSITMDTLYAEGQRRYVESLSSYARQFLMRMKKPEVDFIKGLCPAIAIEQKVSTSNARSTVGTLTEIYDYLRILFARIGHTFSPISGQEVKKNSVTDVVNFIQSQAGGTKAYLLTAFAPKHGRSIEQELSLLQQRGYTRLYANNEILKIEDIITSKNWPKAKSSSLLIDRFAVDTSDTENAKRIADSVLTAFQEGEGECTVEIVDGQRHAFNNRFEADGMSFTEPSPHFFNFNNSLGACPRCEGYGKVLGISEDKVVPNKSLSVYDDAIVCWKGEKVGEYKQAFLQNAHRFDFPVHRSYSELTDEERELLWNGNQYFEGIRTFFHELEKQLYKVQNRVMLARYRGKTDCPDCGGARLRNDTSYVKIAGKTISQLVKLPIDELLEFFENLAPNLSDFDYTIAKRLILEINTRLRFMAKVGLNYLTLNRLSSSLSGGETQRINLTRTLGSNLTSSLYILDEPSVGLHPRDTNRLVEVLRSLRDLGNTVLVVEHEEDIIKNADYLVDIGPMAGVNGGEVVFAGPYASIYEDASESLTTKYMNGSMQIPLPGFRRKAMERIKIIGARQHNLKNIHASVPLHALTVVTGVSGSGKTTLVKQILYPALKAHLGEALSTQTGEHDGLEVPPKSFTQVEMIEQNPIGRSSRSNPVTYVKAYDDIRALFTGQQLSLIRGYKPKHFSFNVEGGRCETCKGDGEILVEMQFLADVRLECEDCKGQRFKSEILEVKYNDKNIYEVLDLSIDEAMAFFSDEPNILQKIKPLQDVGLGYVRLGQSSSSLSGGEAQRVKLASFLVKENSKEHVLFIFDEPTTGLHFHDVRKLLDALNALVENGHTVVVVEHNMEVIKSADWVIDLGPEGGKTGGHLVYEGTPEGLAQVQESFTGQYLREKL